VPEIVPALEGQGRGKRGLAARDGVHVLQNWRWTGPVCLILASEGRGGAGTLREQPKEPGNQAVCVVNRLARQVSSVFLPWACLILHAIRWIPF